MTKQPSAGRRRGLAATVAMLLLASSGCGVFIGTPIDLFGSNASVSLDGGTASGAPCIEESTPVVGSVATIIAVPADALAVLIEGEHGSDLTWPDGNVTFVTVTLTSATVFSVHSYKNPRHGAPIAANQCSDHARIDAQMQLQTRDGRLHETVGAVSFVAYDDEQAAATFSIAASALKGTYKPSQLGAQCYLGSSFRVLVALDGTHGSLVDQLGTSACAHPDAGAVAMISQAGGHWGTRWRN